MIIYGHVYFNHAIIVSERMLKELQDAILVFYDLVEYKAYLYNGDEIAFDSLEELTSYDNYENRRIKRLVASFGYDNQIYFEKNTSFISSYKYTVHCKYATKNNDESILFSNKIKGILKKGRRPLYYTFITKICMFHFLAFLLGIWIAAVIFLLFNGGLNKTSGTNEKLTESIGIGVLFMLIANIIASFLEKIREKIMPALAFDIGEQIKVNERFKDLASKIFWGIIVAFIMSILTAIIL